MKKTNDMLKLILVLAVFMLTQGCIGVGLFGTKTETLHSPRIYCKGINKVYDYHGNDYRTNVATVTQLQNNWGEPLSITQASTDHEEELWTYKFDRIWCGIAPLLVVPVPLVLPIERQKVVFSVKENMVFKADVTKSGSSGFAFFIVTAEGPFKSVEWNDYNIKPNDATSGSQPHAVNSTDHDSPITIGPKSTREKSNSHTPNKGAGGFLEFGF